MCILVANEPRSYRDVIADALRVQRPHLQVIVAEPEDLDREVVRLSPNMVLCSRLTAAVETHALAWVVLYPNAETRAVISIAGHCRTVGTDLPFPHLLSVIDEVERRLS
jgi:hypothetical protein